LILLGTWPLINIVVCGLLALICSEYAEPTPVMASRRNRQENVLRSIAGNNLSEAEVSLLGKEINKR